jgi:hypothetical protein
MAGLRAEKVFACSLRRIRLFADATFVIINSNALHIIMKKLIIFINSQIAIPNAFGIKIFQLSSLP